LVVESGGVYERLDYTCFGCSIREHNGSLEYLEGGAAFTELIALRLESTADEDARLLQFWTEAEQLNYFDAHEWELNNAWAPLVHIPLYPVFNCLSVSLMFFEYGGTPKPPPPPPTSWEDIDYPPDLPYPGRPTY
jgi:hypothetical protein